MLALTHARFLFNSRPGPLPRSGFRLLHQTTDADSGDALAGTEGAAPTGEPAEVAASNEPQLLGELKVRCG